MEKERKTKDNNEQMKRLIEYKTVQETIPIVNKALRYFCLRF